MIKQDSNDYIFNASEGSLSIIYAYGGTSTYAWHGPENRGATVLNVNTLGDYENTLLSFEMYPNPVSNLLTIQLPVNTEKTEVSILDLTGRLVKTKTTTTNDTSIDVQKISNGIYVVKVATRDKIGVKKFIKK